MTSSQEINSSPIRRQHETRFFSSQTAQDICVYGLLPSFLFMFLAKQNDSHNTRRRETKNIAEEGKIKKD